MSEVRNPKLLLITLRDNLERIMLKPNTGSMCLALYSLEEGGLISREEHRLLSGYLVSKGFSEGRPAISYWWPKGEVQPRLDWLNQKINEL